MLIGHRWASSVSVRAASLDVVDSLILDADHFGVTCRRSQAEALVRVSVPVTAGPRAREP